MSVPVVYNFSVFGAFLVTSGFFLLEGLQLEEPDLESERHLPQFLDVVMVGMSRLQLVKGRPCIQRAAAVATAADIPLVQAPLVAVDEDLL